jgi:DnaJ-class molecular chaperone
MSNETAIEVISEDGLRERSEKLDEIQEMYTEMAFMKEPKMPCNECGGTGSVNAGSLGDICVKCMGARVINQPFYETLVQPDFAAMRKTITEYGNLLKAGTPAAQLPTPSEVFGKEQYNDLFAQGKVEIKALAMAEEAKQLEAGGADCEDEEDIKPWS